jgi:hypothetical protein
MSVVNQGNGVLTEVEADSWCVDRLVGDACARVDAPLPEVMVDCGDEVVVALPDTFTPQPAPDLVRIPKEKGRVWLVDTEEEIVLVRSNGSGKWSRVSWTFELARDDVEC